MVKFKRNINLAEYSNYRIGGPAAYFFEAKNVDEVKSAVKLAKDDELPIFILGGGTNLLINDKGFNGLVLKPNLNFLELTNAGTIKAGAGVLMTDLLNFIIEKELSGLEWAGGLPGTLGGAIRGNAGAFGGEMRDAVAEVESLDTKTGKEITRNSAECYFGYRSSIFKEKNNKEIILAATLKLKKGDPKKIKSAVQEKIDYRLLHQPLDHPNIGSIFKNVDLNKIPQALRPRFVSVIKNDPFPVVPAAYLIKEAGLAGVSHGGAMISPKHPNFIVNVLESTALDVKTLVNLTKKTVKKKFKINLEEEITEV